MSQRSSALKRKRSHSRDLPSSSINPLSHSQSVLSQFSIAGLSETDELPSSYIKDFPHRGLRREISPDSSDQNTDANGLTDLSSDSDEGDGQEANIQKKKKKKKVKSRETQIDVEEKNTINTLIQSIHQFLSSGQITNASRAFGLVLAMKPKGTPFDVRRKHLWAIGAEILMRHGEDRPHRSDMEVEEEDDTEQKDGKLQNQRWGSAENMPRVRSYYEALIQRYPWDYRFPNRVSALDFWPALVSCWIYNANIEHVLALERLDGYSSSSSSSSSFSSEQSSDEGTATNRRVRKVLRKRDKLRIKALDSIESITAKMDNIMQDVPYSKCKPLLKLRAAAAMYLSDLVLPAQGTGKDREAFTRREEEILVARRCLAKVVELGGSLNDAEWGILEPTRKTAAEADASTGEVSYSLPIRSPNQRIKR